MKTMKNILKSIKSNLSISVTPKEESFKFTDNGTFTEEDLRINKKGLKIGNADKKENHSHIEDQDDIQDTCHILGRGSSGAVKKVKHRPTGEILALKVIHLDLNEENRKKTLLELRTLYKSSNESIVKFRGAFYSEGSISIALEFMDGGTLADILKSSKTVPDHILMLMFRRLLEGLHYIHKKLHIIHRDIKPSNILLNSKGEVKISDFGVVGQLNNTVGLATTFTGTVTYMSPERIEAKDHTSNSDIWSLGLTMLECALGYYPFCPPGSLPITFWKLLEQVQTSPIPLPTSPPFSSEFCAMIETCLKKDNTERPGAEELLVCDLI
eukprot:TRINITY_DN4796_c0_g2_i1.p1 TRINITY_DN4796_c0_g2~~TRINITY_DN4796_c0_g2_i1.p1  ORF type:complete len:326 (+),score=60.09 TRINITY_DN4796_c0_g2_i1:89-1066(+)